MQFCEDVPVLASHLEDGAVVGRDLEGVVLVDQRPVISVKAVAEYVTVEQFRYADTLEEEAQEVVLEQKDEGKAVLVGDDMVNDEVASPYLVVF